MRLTALTVCVDYAEYLAQGLKRWHIGCERLVVVTSSRDQDTIELCRQHNVITHITDIFYAGGAVFNKGAALAEAAAVKKLWQPRDEWLLTFDSDIVPPEDWRKQLEKFNLQPGTLYGSYRFAGKINEYGVLPGERMPPVDEAVIGFFTLFHAQDPRLPHGGPLFELVWPHAGNYDTVFTWRWPRCRQYVLPLALAHLGEAKTNWAGRGKEEVLKQIMAARKTRQWREHERLANPPVLGEDGWMTHAEV